MEQGIDLSPTGLTYLVPPPLQPLAVGERVMVPLGRGNKLVAGYVVELSSATDLKSQLKAIHSRDRAGLSLPHDLIELACWISGYYCCPLGMVFATMLPAAVKHGTGTSTRTFVRFSNDGADPNSSIDNPAAPAKLSKLQSAVLDRARELAQSGDGWVELKRLADLAGAKSVAPVKQLVARGQLQAKKSSVVVSDLDLRALSELEPTQAHALNTGQQDALNHLVAHVESGFAVHLLHGVTGSGKTEVYLRLIERLLAAPVATGAAAPGVIVLVPEIALTPQTVARFIARFDSVAVLHSALTAAQRHAQWQRIRAGEARIVVGARSAIFAPLPRVGLIIVDEEHESSYKQDQLPRYHARDVAIKRGQINGIAVVLGSATPSLESYYNAQQGAAGKSTDASNRYFHLLCLPQRVPGMKLPAVEIVDMREERRLRTEHSGRGGVHLLSVRLETSLQQTLHNHGQSILLLNRRGYANYIACPDHRCGWMMNCEYCDATMVYHRDGALPAGGVVRCHHCNAEQLLPTTCPTCGKRVTVFGLGTQRVEEELTKKFPHARLLRMDSDAMRTGRDYQQSLDAFRRGEVDILLGTQMIAKGLDFPCVRLVGVISGDTSLHMPDFRASERTFQLIAQVAGRAGRSEQPGKVIVQTFSPDDPAINLAAAHDYETFAQRELALRAEVDLPPISRMARIVVRDKDHAACCARATALAEQLHACNEQLGGKVRVRGPAPCPIARIAEFHRLQIELIACPPQAAATLQRLMTALRNVRSLISDMHTAVDVDPVALL